MTDDIEFSSELSVKLIDHMGNDLSVLAAMMVSTMGVESLDMLDTTPEAARGRLEFLMANRHGCYDSATEVLTSDGWKFWPDVSGDESFLTLDTDTDEIEWQAAERLVRKPVSGPMVRIKTMQVDALVTPDHNMYARRRRAPHLETEFSLVPAKDFMEASHRVRLGGGLWDGPEMSCLSSAALIGFFVGDGYSKNGGTPEFSLRKPRKIEYLAGHAHNAGFEVTVGANSTCYLRCTDEMREILSSCYDDTREKVLPKWVMDSGPKTLTSVLEGLMNSDGYVSERGRESYSTTSQILAGQIQEIAVKLGRSATVHDHPFTNDSGHWGTRPRYGVTVYRERNSRPKIGWTVADRANQVTIEHYDGDVHCVTVPNGTLYVRRNGLPMWCGNSPFEHSAMTCLVEAPIAVFREWHRHRIGQCLPGDARVAVGTWKNGQTKRIADVYSDWHEGVHDSLGRTRFLPSCRHLIARSLNTETGLIEQTPMVDVYKSGVKPIRKVTLTSGHVLRCSDDHQLYSPEGWVKAKDVTAGDVLGRQGKGVAPGEPIIGIPRSLRVAIQEWTFQQKAEIVKIVDMCAHCGNMFDYVDLQVDHRVPVSQNLALALDVSNLQPLCKSCHRSKTNTEQLPKSRRRPQRLCVKWERVVENVPDGEEMTYDIEMPGPWHNFVADNFIVHNSYNEVSGRYTKLPPKFYIPPPERPLVQVGKPGEYTYVPGTTEQYAEMVADFAASHTAAYAAYQRHLDRGIAKEVARGCLPVYLYTSMYVTLNPRSLMAFLSLRSKDDNATFPSFPMWEIEQCADRLEEHFAGLFPITHSAFRKHGSVCP